MCGEAVAHIAHIAFCSFSAAPRILGIFVTVWIYNYLSGEAVAHFAHIVGFADLAPLRLFCAYFSLSGFINTCVGKPLRILRILRVLRI